MCVCARRPNVLCVCVCVCVCLCVCVCVCAQRLKPADQRFPFTPSKACCDLWGRDTGAVVGAGEAGEGGGERLVEEDKVGRGFQPPATDEDRAGLACWCFSICAQVQHERAEHRHVLVCICQVSMYVRHISVYMSHICDIAEYN